MTNFKQNTMVQMTMPPRTKIKIQKSNNKTDKFQTKYNKQIANRAKYQIKSTAAGFTCTSDLTMMDEKIFSSSPDSCIRRDFICSRLPSFFVCIKLSQYRASLASLRQILIRNMKSFLLKDSFASM